VPQVQLTIRRGRKAQDIDVIQLQRPPSSARGR
jgi:hypothetical protein